MDRYAKELERSIFNWYYGGEEAAPEPMLNALSDGLENNMQVLVPLKVSDAMVEMIGEPENLKPGDTLSAKEDIAIGFRHLVVYEEGEYFIPLFTSEEEVNKGKSITQEAY